MWITFCQEVKLDRTIAIFVYISPPFWYTTDMEKVKLKIKKIKRKRKHGFRSRMKTHGGKKVVKRRRDKKRERIAV